MDGHSGGVPLVPIPNTKVKTADVLDSTVLCTGNLVRCPPFFSEMILGIIMFFNSTITIFHTKVINTSNYLLVISHYCPIR